MSAALKQAMAEREDAGKSYGATLLELVEELMKFQKSMMGNLWTSGSKSNAIAASREYRETMKFWAQATGQISDRPEHKHLHVHVDPETALKVAETYVQRHKQLPQETGG